MSKTPAIAFNSKICGKRVELSSDEENLLSTALSIIWLKTNKNVESCIFNQDKVRLTYEKNGERIYFDLQESLSDITFINKTYFFLSLGISFLNNIVHFFLISFLDNIVHFFYLYDFVSEQYCPLFLLI